VIPVAKSALILAALASLASVTTHATDVFERKPGLWKVTLHFPNESSPHLAEQCLAADTDARVARIGMETLKTICSKVENHKVGGTFVTDSTCKIGSHTRQSQTVTTPDGDNAYHVVVKTHDDHPATPAKVDEVYTQEGHWAGACPATMQPGDQILQVGPQMPGGMKTNLLATSPAG
jgi:hypothetical protein